MKKVLAIILAALFILSLAACSASSKDPTEETKEEVLSTAAEDIAVAGGWTLVEHEAVKLPDDIQQAFDKATSTLTGMGLIPVAYIGTQVVSGRNIAILCEGLTVTMEPDSSLKVVIIYEDLSGNAEITNIADFNLTDYTTSDGSTDEQLMGGWYAPDEITKEAIPAEAQKAFDAAVEGYTGNQLDLMALLGTQIVSGTNYAFLCHSTLVTAEPVSSIQVVKVYEDLEGKAEISNIYTLDIAAFTK